jgi:hypothetical protein
VNLFPFWRWESGGLGLLLAATEELKQASDFFYVHHFLVKVWQEVQYRFDINGVTNLAHSDVYWLLGKTFLSPVWEIFWFCNGKLSIFSEINFLNNRDHLNTLGYSTTSWTFYSLCE